ncbi:tubby-like F-box protein 3 [Phtheirospermum japonicum]|uniref:Tubby-like F-box protein 3 n=1 Tax=Phtheirospermum japonicum TaxID=374723 RepID=A0A830D594_9LAMI|nr:tubby-like F-box protein 3 [Phtheirospermum japonicum]
MKGEFGSLSKKGFEGRFGYVLGLRTRSQRVVEDDFPVADACRQSCWTNMPPELLMDVLMRIEESESTWPLRKNVVACAGVCRNWREIIKDIVTTLEVSGKLTFPVSLKQECVKSRGEHGSCGSGIWKYPELCLNIFGAVRFGEKSNDWSTVDRDFSVPVRFGYFQVPLLSRSPINLYAYIMPGPRNALIQCFIKRNRNNQTYHLYLNLSQASTADGKFLLSARRCRRPTYTDYVISLKPDDASKGSSNYIGKLRSNFLGTKFTIYDAQPSNAGAKVARSRSTRMVGTRQVSPKVAAGNYPVAHISYELNVLGSRGPRRMHCVMDAIPASAIEPEGVAPTPTELLPGNSDSFTSLPFFRSKSTRAGDDTFCPAGKDEALVLKNKSPRWHDQLQCWCLNFNGRVTAASVKNFQLENGGARGEDEQDSSVILQFGKVGKDIFTMDYQYPISAFQAFAVCLSSFDTKIACE